MDEKLILKFKLPEIGDLSTIECITTVGYRMTGNKFSVEFNGSKGYLSNVAIMCEGFQEDRNNVIWLENLRTKKGTLKSKMVSIFHSEKGVRVAV